MGPSVHLFHFLFFSWGETIQNILPYIINILPYIAYIINIFFFIYFFWQLNALWWVFPVWPQTFLDSAVSCRNMLLTQLLMVKFFNTISKLCLWIRKQNHSNNASASEFHVFTSTVHSENTFRAPKLWWCWASYSSFDIYPFFFPGSLSVIFNLLFALLFQTQPSLSHTSLQYL